MTPSIRRALPALALLLAACAPQGPPPVACGDAGYWALRGEQDGADGRSEDVWQGYAAQCPAVGPAERQAWRAGLDRGRESWCTLENAVEQGRRARTLGGVCEGFQPDRLAWAARSGREELFLRQEIQEYRRDAFGWGWPGAGFPGAGLGGALEASGSLAIARRAEADLARLIAEREARFAAWRAEDGTATR